MSNFSNFVKEQKDKDLKWFFGEDVQMVSNKYFRFKRVIDEDNIIIITKNIKPIKDSLVLIVDKDKAVYLKDWQIRKVHNYDENIEAYAVKLNRKYFKPYTFRFEFDGFQFEQPDNFDSLKDVAAEQEEENLKFAHGWMKF